ncbi:unnamed protein product [Rotaria sp. Silwood1]|nr:unnamed protein product [Rotaria sp. Silwood1]CAF3412089.1 unnamed protein product [Rotaria sp. Silwood1]CAF4667513.1 unnamed protein product [Rotaria sp. Silwood1]CAF5089114.1 unnamed protein product [Rotaria sp. Silwood1]
MLLRMADVQQDETQLNLYRCLGKLMPKPDIKTMETPSKLASIYLKFLTNTIDDPKKMERFYSVLQNFVQHDQVKVELIKQNVFPIFMRCITETKSDLIKVQTIVLEILLALSFNNDALTILRKDTDFMTQIRNLESNTNLDKSNLQRAAEGLLWKLDKEGETVAKSTTLKSYQYDIMISYSHSDRQLCYQIHERLFEIDFMF